MAPVSYVDEVLEMVNGKKAVEVSNTVGTIADIISITSSRQTQRIFLPLNIFTCIYNIPAHGEGKVID